MLLNVQKSEDFSSNLKAKNFSVEMNSMMFYSVINGIYADKIRSPMRELATNARDGHALAGKLDEPFDIHLPTSFNPVFSVRDYGISMSEDEIMGLYSTMFASSKRETNEAVGMIGLGSKSPFAYVSTFTVTAWLDGTRRDYVAFINDENMPQISAISESPSDEPTGIEVSFSVRLEDIPTFREAAHQVFFGFDPKPNIKDFNFKDFTTSYVGDGYTLYVEDQEGYPWPGKAMARQGCVIYPIDPSALGPRFKENPIWNMSIIVDFPIGQLSVNTSREALGYDAMTIKNIESRMAVVLDDMTNIVQKEIDIQPTYLDACDVFAKKRHANIIYKMLGGTLKYRDDKLVRFQFRAKTAGDNHSYRLYKRDHKWMNKIAPNVSFPNVRTPVSKLYFPEDLINTTVVLDIADEKVDKVPSRMRQYFSQQSHNIDLRTDIIWLKADTLADAQKVLEDLGEPVHVNISTIPPLSIPRVGSTKRRKEFLTFLRFNSDLLEAEVLDVSQDVDIAYVFNEGRWCYYTGTTGPYWAYRNSMHQNLMTLIDKIGDEDLSKVVLYSANQNFLDRMKKKSTVNMVPFCDMVLETLQKHVDMNVLAKYLNDYEVNNQYKYVPYNVTRTLNWGSAALKSHKLMPQDVLQFLADYGKEKVVGVTGNDPLYKYIDIRHTLKNMFPLFFSDKANHGVRAIVTDESSVFRTLSAKYHLLERIESQQQFNHYMELLSK